MNWLSEMYEKPVGILFFSAVAAAIGGGIGFWVMLGLDQKWEALVWLGVSGMIFTVGSVIYTGVKESSEKRDEDLKAAREARRQEQEARRQEQEARRQEQEARRREYELLEQVLQSLKSIQSNMGSGGVQSPKTDKSE